MRQPIIVFDSPASVTIRWFGKAAEGLCKGCVQRPGLGSWCSRGRGVACILRTLEVEKVERVSMDRSR